MGTTTSITILQQSTGPHLTLLNMLIDNGAMKTFDLSTGFNFQLGKYPITWVVGTNNTSTGTTAPIPATSQEYPGLGVEAILTITASLDGSGKVVYEPRSATLSLNVTSIYGSNSSGTGISWRDSLYTGYNGRFNVRLDDGSTLALSPSFSWPIMDVDTNAFFGNMDYELQLRSGIPYPNPIRVTKYPLNRFPEVGWGKSSRSDYVARTQYTAQDCRSRLSTFGDMEINMHIVFYNVNGKQVGVPFRVDSVKIIDSNRICGACGISGCDFLRMPVTTFSGSEITYANLDISFTSPVEPRDVILTIGSPVPEDNTPSYLP